MIYFLVFLLLSSFGIILIGIRKEKRKIDPTSKQTYTFPIKAGKNSLLHYRLYIVLGVWMIKKNAVWNSKKKHVIINFCESKFPDESNYIEQDFDELYARSIHVRSMARWVVTHLKSAEERVELISFLIEIGLIENSLIDRELIALVRFGEWIGVTHRKIDSLILDHYSTTDNEPERELHQINNPIIRKRKAFQVFGLTIESSNYQIKKQYKNLVLSCHPDRFPNASTSEKEELKQKFIVIQAAYEELIR